MIADTPTLRIEMGLENQMIHLEKT